MSGSYLRNHTWELVEKITYFNIYRCSGCGLMRQERLAPSKICTVYDRNLSIESILTGDAWPEGSEPTCEEFRMREALE